MINSEQNVAKAIRGMIARNEVEAEERITETSVAKLLGVSRTPARGALRSLEAEGLIEKRDGRGYRVRRVDAAKLPDALRVRGALEGLAARTLAETGIGPRAADRLEKSLAATAALVARGLVDQKARETHRVANAIFHETIVQECGNPFIGQALERLKIRPMLDRMASSAAEESDAARRMRLTVSHTHHAIVYKAIRDRDGTRAEAIMREHATFDADYSGFFSNILALA